MVGPSAGAAAARGLESGFGFGLQMQGLQRAEEDRQRRNRLQEEQLGFQREDRLQRQQDRQRGLDLQASALQQQDDDRALAAIEAQIAAQRDEGAALFQQYGRDVPPELAEPYAKRSGELRAQRHRLLDARWQPNQRRVQDTISRIQTGQVQLEDLDAGDLYEMLAVAARRDPRDFLSGGGSGAANTARGGLQMGSGSGSAPASKVSQAMTDFIAGIETGNEGLMLDSANVLLEPELKVGVGEDSPHGGRVVGKRIVKFLPHPQDPSQVLPVVKVFVSRGKGEKVKADPDAPEGATGYYFAPITEGRTSDPDDPIKSISLQQGMEYLAKLQTLGEAINSNPALRAKVESAAAEQDKKPSTFLSSFLANGGKLPKPPKVRRETRNMGGHQEIDTVDDETGQVLGTERRAMSPVPRRAEPTAEERNASRTRREIDQAVRDGLISPEEARETRRRQLLGGASPRSQHGTAELIRIADEAEADTARRAGLQRRNGQWVTSDDRPASPQMLGMLARVRSAALAHAERETRAGRQPMATEAATAAREAVPPVPAQRFQPGQVYTDAQGRRAKYGGQDASGRDIWQRAE